MKLETGHILVVDDNEMNRDMLSRRLIRQGHTVETAIDGKSALDILEEKAFDLILLDVMMPEVSGLEVLKTLREKHTMADMPIIMVTAKDQSEDIVEALKQGANDYITKPVDFPVASARIQTQLALKRLSLLKDEFLAIASHDLKNPLTGILGFTGVLQVKLSPGKTIAADDLQCINRIEKLAWVMNRIIGDFLDFQALEDGELRLQFQDINLNETATLSIENNKDYASRKKIHLEPALDPELGLSVADEARIQQVMDNFLSNAIKFCPEESRVLVKTRKEDLHIIFEVSDTGPGLTEADLQKIFTKYSRLSNKPTGGEKSSGLGLAICKKIIELHMGEIGVYNNPTSGVTFWFKLPSSPPQEDL